MSDSPIQISSKHISDEEYKKNLIGRRVLLRTVMFNGALIILLVDAGRLSLSLRKVLSVLPLTMRWWLTSEPVLHCSPSIRAQFPLCDAGRHLMRPRSSCAGGILSWACSKLQLQWAARERARQLLCRLAQHDILRLECLLLAGVAVPRAVHHLLAP